MTVLDVRADSAVTAPVRDGVEVLEVMPAALVSGFPSEGAWSEVVDESGDVVAAGWFSIDADVSTPESGRVVLVSPQLAVPGRKLLSAWAGSVRPSEVRAAAVAPGCAPVWFGQYVSPVHEAQRVVVQLEAEREKCAVLERAQGESVRKHQEWIENLNDLAIEWADDNSLCEQFDRFMEENGLRGRERDQEVEVTVTATMTVAVRGVSQRDAEERIDSDDIREHISGHLSYLDFDYALAD
ncbi:hypothetical protein ACMHYT_30185 [Rhodococcus qingshengii]|jgi:hypothetical protein|uniref:Uncharacterized protein n=1 Tax=Rhodococcus erythropolis TaxID=1833 RepID=A0A6G9D4R9_RHOER|nr:MULTISPECIES: hypothetical protein [Rhodococcus]EQM29660.1 hypothetical protein N601_31805 [Rhodococcus erythropolis DN1]MBF7737717.1 hypothetical protein [Rhodococcus erythropolis]MBS2993537.1 hypothetical protein [Rhodococcus erythropolis]MBW0282229.1 hypothetical protein [Rhodococcus sp. FH8]MCD2136335.1 hypothetical protein [Rhodococcus qingshengii]